MPTERCGDQVRSGLGNPLRAATDKSISDGVKSSRERESERMPDDDPRAPRDVCVLRLDS